MGLITKEDLELYRFQRTLVYKENSSLSPSREVPISLVNLP
jgi:hypothetical protein